MNRSLHMLYTYYVFSHEDAPEKTFGRPFVKYHGLSSKPTRRSQADALLKDYRGVQLTLMKYEDFFNLIDPKNFCCSADDVTKGLCQYPDELRVNKKPGESYDDVEVYAHTVRFPDPSSTPNVSRKDEKLRVRTTGVYILMLSNCGILNNAVVSGSVVVKNSYGFLPGNEYHKLPFYGWLSLFYMVLATVWMALSMRWWKEVITIQFCIAGVIGLGLIEAFVWYLFFSDWNDSGMRGNAIFIVAMLSSVAKSIFSYMLVLVGALGWGVTRPYLDKDVIRRIQIICLLYIVLGVVREAVLSFRNSHSLSTSFVLLCLLPVSLLNGVIFYWVFTALSSLIQTLKERGQTAKLQLFQHLWNILLLSLGITTVCLLYQIFAFTRTTNLAKQWMHQWLFTDGAPHILFLLVMAAMMWLWAPHKNSQRYAYNQLDVKGPDVLGKDDKVSPDWVDEVGAGDDDDDDAFWTETGTASAPQGSTAAAAPAATIGVSTSATGVLKNTMSELDSLGFEDGIPPAKSA